MSARRLVALLGAVFVLAIVVPYAAVRTLHERRIAAADATLTSMADAASRSLDRSPQVNTMIGQGRVPRATDTRWLEGTTSPFVAEGAHVMAADPWGNGYVVNIGAAAGRVVWLLSAGPDGVIQTPFDGSTAEPAGDDRGRRLR